MTYHGVETLKAMVKPFMSKPTVLTLGHSNRSIGELISKVQENTVSVLVDVRTQPYSRYCPHFNKNALQRALEAGNIQYLWKGQNLGGMDVNLDYDKTINEVVQMAETTTVCILCTEKDYTACHRHLLLEPSLKKAGAKVKHILWD